MLYLLIITKHNWYTTSPLSSDSPHVDSSHAAQPQRQSTRVCRPPERYGFEDPLSLSATTSSISIPSSYKQKHECWKEAIETELLAFEENQTWDIVTCPPSVKPLDSKFIFSVKHRPDGSIERRYKARLVVFGNKQQYGNIMMKPLRR